VPAPSADPDPRLALAELLGQLARAGASPLARPASAGGDGGAATAAGTAAATGDAAPADDAAAALAAVAAGVAACRRCPLGALRTHAVPGEGPATARLMVVGEGPGAVEDREGRPFVGPAGQLLDRILERGLGLSRREVFVANVLKCRPPGNRDPEPEERDACAPWLEEQIRLVRPELLLALGRHAAQTLLGSTAPLGALRGRVLERPGGGPPVVATYHPAYLLRNPAAKAACWADLQAVLRHLGLRPPVERTGNRSGPTR